MTRALPLLTTIATTAATAALGLGVAPPASAAPPQCFGQDATIVGTADDDEVKGTAGRDVIVLLGGRDSVDGRDGNDLICGGDGNDAIAGGDGDDRLDGGTGHDWLSGDFDDDQLLGGVGNDGLQGGPGSDDLEGGPDRNNLSGGSGADELLGGDGGEYLAGGPGADTIAAGGGADNVFGQDGADQAGGGTGDDSVAGGGGEDEVLGGEGDDTLSGDDASAVRNEDLTWTDVGEDDVLAGGPGRDAIVLTRDSHLGGRIVVDLTSEVATGQGDDTLDGVEDVRLNSDHDDEVTGSGDDNRILMGGGHDTATGLGGDDTFVGDRGDDSWDGGAGSDTASYEQQRSRVSANLASGLARSKGAGRDTLVDFENLTGGQVGDVLTGNDEPNVLRGLMGQDVLRGLAGDDVLRGGYNRPDRIDRLDGGPGDDLLDGSDPSLDPDLPLAFDQVDYSTSDEPVVVDLEAGTATGDGTDTLLGIDDAVGSIYDDVILGSDSVNELNGGPGDDELDGRSGDDELESSFGDDAYEGGDGTDVIDLSLSHEPVTADLGAGTATGHGTDTIAGVENLYGSLFGDDLTGDDGPNVLDGAFGEDTMHGAGGDDTLLGDRAADSLYGDAGEDRLDGEVGDDLQDGGADDDVLVSTPGDDDHVGGPGDDLLDLGLEPVLAEVDLVDGTAVASGEDTVAEVEDLLGTLYNDRLLGDDAANRIDAGPGLDEISARDGDDNVFGGNDRNQDFISGGPGTDTIDYAISYRRVTVDLQAGYSEGTGGDVLIAIEHVIGSIFDDDLRGDELANVINGGPGDDVIDLRAGDDTGDGDDGTDSIDGGQGTDDCTAEFLTACE